MTFFQNRNISASRICLLTILIMIIYLFCFVIYDFLSGSESISFTGEVETAILAVSSSESQYQWSLNGSYICYDEAWGTPNLARIGTGAIMSTDSLCSGVYGTSTRKHLALEENVSLAFVRDTTVEISIVDAPILAQSADFPRRQLPKQVLIIKSITPLSHTESCGNSSDGTPILVGSDGDSVELPQQAEIHIPVTERTLMPFVGRIRLGQSNSSNTPNQLRSGTVAIYRPVTGLFGREDPQLVSSTSLFPGDVVKFQTDAACLSPSAGFLRAAEDDSGSFIEVVASMRSRDGVARIERRTPGGSSTSGYFTVKLRVADAIFGHPLTLWLGALVTLFVVGKEWLSSFQSSFELQGSGKGVLSRDRSKLVVREAEDPNRSDAQT